MCWCDTQYLKWLNGLVGSKKIEGVFRIKEDINRKRTLCFFKARNKKSKESPEK